MLKRQTSRASVERTCHMPWTKTDHAMSSSNYHNLRWIKEWICSERPNDICAIVKAWLCQGSRIWPKCDVTWIQWPMRAVVSFRLQRNLRIKMRRTRLLGYSPQLACLGCPVGFIPTCLYSSKLECRLAVFILKMSSSSPLPNYKWLRWWGCSGLFAFISPGGV